MTTATAAPPGIVRLASRCPCLLAKGPIWSAWRQHKKTRGHGGRSPLLRPRWEIRASLASQTKRARDRSPPWGRYREPQGRSCACADCLAGPEELVEIESRNPVDWDRYSLASVPPSPQSLQRSLTLAFLRARRRTRPSLESSCCCCCCHCEKKSSRPSKPPRQSLPRWRGSGQECSASLRIPRATERPLPKTIRDAGAGHLRSVGH
jgi:hypothetical protein